MCSMSLSRKTGSGVSGGACYSGFRSRTESVSPGKSIGPIKPNLVMFGWSSDPSRAPAFVHSLQTATLLKMSIVLVHDGGLPGHHQKKRKIDIWWRGAQWVTDDDSCLSDITDSGWSGTSIRILRIVQDESQIGKARKELNDLVESSRMNIAVEIICSREPFEKLVRLHSSNATVIFIGFEVPDLSTAEVFQSSLSSLLSGLPTTLLVRSTGEADLTS